MTSRPRALLLGALAAVLLLAHARVASNRLDLRGGSTDGRFWEEMNIAVERYRFGVFPYASYPVRASFFTSDPRAADFREAVAGAAEHAGIRPWQFWRTVPAALLVPEERFLVQQSDDRGRALALAAGFRLLGGVSPFLLFWLGPLVAAVVLAWSVYEIARRAGGVAAVVLGSLVSCSPFVVDTLALAYSQAGFHVIAVLTVVPLAVAAALGPPLRTRDLLLRAAAAGLLLAVAMACRRGVLLVIPGFLMALALGALQVAASRRIRALRLGASVVLLLLPPVVIVGGIIRMERATLAGAETHRRHNPWLNFWEGLGDFDRTHGYTWSDKKAMQFVVDHGGEPRLSRHSERIFRRKVLADVREDPSWYAGIVVRRLVATVTQQRLWPQAAWSGDSFARATSPNEGLMDSYYDLVATADWIGVADARVELPILLWLVPPALLLVLAIRRDERGATARRGVLALGCLAAATLPAPVLVSTAGALEPQSFVIVYMLAAALLAGLWWRQPTATTITER